MDKITIIQIISAILVILLVLFQVSKEASGLAGLMGSTSNGQNKKESIDKSTKYMLCLILFFIGISFYSSYQKSQSYKSVVSEEVSIQE